MLAAPSTQCIKAKSLREKGFGNFADWLRHPNSLYVGRTGRIFITTAYDYFIFHYKGSEWANLFVLAKDGKTAIIMKNGAENLRAIKYSREDSLSRYEAHVCAVLWNKLGELDGKVLGCFCSQGGAERCHAQVLVRLWKEKNNIN
jgi:hypothetical protein